MKILVTGAAGMLGTSLIPVLDAREHTVKATDINLLDSRISRLDVRNIEEFMEVGSDFRPDLIMHLAAETDLEVCESRVDYAYEENFIGTQNACRLCHEHDTPLVFISTAGVFDGTKRGAPYTEFDSPNPVNVYGASKFHAEQIVRQTVPSHYIVRAGWMVGGGKRDKKFVSKIIKKIEAGEKTIYAVSDRFGTPTYAPAFSETLEKIVRTGFFGTYHLACKGSGSRYDVASEILRIMGRDDVELKPVSSEFFKEEYFAPRPVSEEMRNLVLDLRSMNTMPHWKNALEEYLKREFL